MTRGSWVRDTEKLKLVPRLCAWSACAITLQAGKILERPSHGNELLKNQQKLLLHMHFWVAK